MRRSTSGPWGRGEVPLARRNLVVDRRRLVASGAAVGLALMLILLLSGLWEGVESRTAVYEDNSGADLFVAQKGTRNFFSAQSSVPLGLVGALERNPSVRWAAPVRGTFSILELHDRKVPVYLVGSTPGRQGGPWDLSEGRPPRGDDEVVVGRVLRQRHGVRVGDRLQMLGRQLQVVGIADTDLFMTSFVFTTLGAANSMVGGTGRTSFVLVSTDDPAKVRKTARAMGYVALDRDQLRRADLDVVARPFRVPIRLMVAVAFAIGSLVIALTTYSAVIERRREYGILLAIGTTPRRLYRLVVAQTLALAIVGFTSGTLLFWGGRVVLGLIRPQFAVVLTPMIVGQTAAAAVAMALVASVVPARRLTRLDPAEAYRGS